MIKNHQTRWFLDLGTSLLYGEMEKVNNGQQFCNYARPDPTEDTRVSQVRGIYIHVHSTLNCTQRVQSLLYFPSNRYRWIGRTGGRF